MVRITTSISIDKELIQKIDLERGLVNRSRFIEFLLNDLLKKELENATN